MTAVGTDSGLRRLQATDAEATWALADAAFRALEAEQGGPRASRSSEVARARGVDHHRHLQRTDPAGCWVAVRGDEPVGVALALRRGPLWFLSLLTVAPGLQGQGVGRRLLDAALQTAGGHAVLMSSNDPRALRRYGSAGFALHPGYTVEGPVDRALLPAVPLVREGDPARDADLVEGLAARLRGAPYDPDLDQFGVHGRRLLVLPDRGYVVLREGQVGALGARDPEAAEQLLWAALAEVGPQAEVELVLGVQQWAVRVALRARLSLRAGASLCVRGAADVHPTYLTGGTYG